MLEKEEFFEAVQKHIKLDSKQLSFLDRAFDFGCEAHKGQKRASDEDYFTAHCTNVALHLAEIGMDYTMIAAGLLHDTIEDTDVTKQDIEKKFGKDVAFLVEGVSKLGKLKYRGNERHQESLRKFFVAIAEDMRVVILKLCDRWHNLETIEHLPVAKQKRIAEESMLIHGQLASRLTMGKLTSIINDLAFPYADPVNYEKTKKLRDLTVKKAEACVRDMYRDSLKILTEQLGYTPVIDRRIKGTYSLYKKLERRDWNIEEIYDLIAIRIIVENEAQCYQSLGAIHAKWRPVLGRVKDYIAVPKPNGYQSLHTAVFTGKGPIVEIQIRTKEMHDFAEFGIAAHHSYKQAGSKEKASKKFDWITQLGEIQQDEALIGSEYLKELRTDFFQDRIFAMTPTGDVIDLPQGATVLDFAFAVHTELGMTAQGGKVNGIYKAIKTPLASEDIVEIVTAKNAQPKMDWLNWSVTNLAHSRIRHHLGMQRKHTSKKAKVLGALKKSTRRK